MAERASVLQRAQIGPESVTAQGTAVAATKRLGATSIQINPAGNINRFGPVGEKFDTVTAIGKEWAALAINGEGSYMDLTYLLAGLIRNATPVQQGGTAAYKTTFTPQSSAEDVVRTYTIEQGEVAAGGRASRVTYGMINSLNIEWSRERVGISGNGMGQREADDIPLSTSATYTLTANVAPPTAGTFTLTYAGQTTAGIAFGATPAAVQAALELLSTVGAGNVEVSLTTLGPTLATASTVYTITFKRALAAQPITLTGTFTGLTASGSIALAAGTVGAAPTLLGVVPILGNQIDVWADDTSGGIGVTQLLRVFKGSFSYANRFSPVWPVNSSLPSFSSHVEVKPEAMFKFSLAADDVGQGMLALMRTGATKYMRWRARGANIASTFYYQAQIDMAAKIADVVSHKDEDGIYQNDIVMTLVQDSNLGYPFQAEVTNTIVTL